MKTFNVYVMTAVLLLSLPCIAQKKENHNIKRLHVGDTVPEVILNRMYNSNKASGKLSDFRGKALILDFWNHACSNCIAALPKMEHLRNDFKDDFEVLLVTWQSMEQFSSLFRNSPIVKSCKLPMTFSDSTLCSLLFPHSGEPYHVWIDKNGIVRGMTSGEYATAENVRDLIAGKPLKIQLKEHLTMKQEDMFLPRLLINDGALTKYVLSFTKIQSVDVGKPYQIDTVRIGKSLIDNPITSYSMLMKSVFHLGAGGAAASPIINPVTGEEIGQKVAGSLISLYQSVYDIPFEMKVIIEEGGDQYFDPGENATLIERERYYRDGFFIYELVCPNIVSTNDEKSRNILKKDLEYVFGMKGSVELRALKCLVLFRTVGVDKLTTKGGLEIWEDTKSAKGLIINNNNFSVLLSYFTLLKNQKNGPVFINETGIEPTRKVDMILHSKMTDIHALNLELERYGLGIKEETRLLPAFVLRKIL